MTDQEQQPPQESEQSPAQEETLSLGTDLVVSLEGFDGPIDLLLSLAREQKVDLAKISILDLTEQYLAFIASARKLCLEVAADYLVMAAWLAYLKSRLLLPDPPADELSPAGMADALKFQLLRLEAMQKAAQQLLALPQLGQDFFLRGRDEPREIELKPIYYLPLYELLSALGAPLRRKKPVTYDIKPQKLFSLDDGLRRLRRLLGDAAVPRWSTLEAFLPDTDGEDVLEEKSALASTFAATLELCKAGEIELQQSGPYAQLYVRPKDKKEAHPAHEESDEP